MMRIATCSFALLVCWAVGSVTSRGQEPVEGVLPRGLDDRPLNTDFETGTLEGWIAEGAAFQNQPIEGDTVHARRSDMRSRHAGRFWVGSYEREGDAPRGTLTSAPFRVSKPFASFLLAGGSNPSSRLELVRPEDGNVLFQVTGDDTEELKRIALDLSQHVGETLAIRLVDDGSGGWGHINFDDFRLHDEKPAAAERDAPPPMDSYAHSGLSPEESARAMSVPEGFHVTLAAGEPDIVRPIAMTLDDRGRVWVAENHAYPFKVAPEDARDRVLIFEDTDGDGKFDSRKVFTEGLNMVTGLEYGFGGIWIGAAPELLFIPDADGDDRPDGPPQVMLDGWGLEDTHETLNSFMWGPDGWLYGTHGVFTHSRVGKPGTPDEDRVPINAGIWRYHPTKHEFEVFAQGTSNPWGLDFDDRGQCIIEACVIPHLFHMIQGGRYQRQAGQHFNPYTYDDIKQIGDHVHYLGDNPHRGNNRSDAAGGGHAHSGLMVYLGGAWPEEYRGGLFMNNIHGARLNRDVPERSGSGFIGRHAPDFLLANDRASQILDFRYGPDGNVWVIDWYDLQQCHVPDASVHDKNKGRIYKVSYGEPKAVQVDLKTWDSANLVALLTTPVVGKGVVRFGHSNEWYLRHARRILQERGLDAEASQWLAHLAFDGTWELNNGLGGQATGGKLEEPKRLRALWMLHVTGRLDEEHVARGLANESEDIRAWTIQLACENRNPSSATLDTMAELAKSDPSPVVRLYLASALQRLRNEQRWDIIAGLLTHGEDAGDHNLPLMDWYAAEPLAEVDTGRALDLAMGSRIPLIRDFMVRRIGAIGTEASLALLVKGLAGTESSEARMSLLNGLNESLKGRRQVAMPAGWPEVFATLLESDSAEIRSQATALSLTFGDPQALVAMRTMLADESADADRRGEALAALLKVRDPELPPVLRGLVRDGNLGGQAIRGLATYEDAETPKVLLDAYAALTPALKRDALATLAARAASARALLDAVGQGAIPAADLSADLIRSLRSHRDEEIERLIAEHWGSARESSGDKAALIDRYRTMLASQPESLPDVHLGRTVFAKTCQQCHTLFGVGDNVGPDITGANRADLEYVLSNVLDPGALIGKDYQATLVATTDGRVLTGLVRAEDANAITLTTANETLTLPLDEIDERAVSDQSMMPDDLWSPLSEHEVRSLVAYLASPGQVPALATTENASTLFNGRDLTGWIGDPALWSVENGEIVGRSTGLDRNEFLASDLLADDFRLSLEVMLVDDEGNSGIQFRSERLDDGEVAGYQADIGPGWWGKLYEEHGRGLLWEKSGEPYVRRGAWNRYEIRAEGTRVRTYLNGQLCVDLDDPEARRRGIFAFQLHSGGPTEVRFRNIELTLPKVAAESGSPTAQVNP